MLDINELKVGTIIELIDSSIMSHMISEFEIHYALVMKVPERLMTGYSYDILLYSDKCYNFFEKCKNRVNFMGEASYEWLVANWKILKSDMPNNELVMQSSRLDDVE